MSETALRRIAWALLGFAAACSLAGLAILLISGESGEGGIFPVLAAITFSLVGALVAAGRPRNPVGWLLLTIGVTAAIGLPTSALYEWDRQHAGTFTGAAFNAWLGGALWLLWIGFLVPRVMLLFPNGKLPSRRWRVVSISQFIVLAGLMVSNLKPGPITDYEEYDNPFGIGPLSGVFDFASHRGALFMPLFLVAAIGPVVSLIVRFRHSRGIERLQLKWFTWAVAVTAVLWIGGSLLPAQAKTIVEPLALSSLCLAPITIGIAVLRYRLYEIDRLISRTLVYGALTVVLGGAYVGLVLAGQCGVLVVCRRLEPRDRRVDTRRSRAVPARALARATLRRPALLPAPLRRTAHARELRGAAARADRPEHARARSRGRRRRDDAADTHLRVAANGSDVVKRPWTWLLAWGLWAAFVVLITATMIIDVTTVSPQEEGESLTSDIGIVIAFAAFATVGALVASRLPRNAVGWLFLTSPLFGTVAGFSAEYAYRAYVTDPGSVPAGPLFGWLYLWTWFPALIAIGLVVLLFPDGRVPGRRWRPLLWAYVAFSVLGVGGAAIYPGPIDQEWPGKPQNPLGVEGLKEALDLASGAGIVAVLGILLATLASAVVRFRRSRGDERLQLKWMMGAAMLLVIHIVFTEAVPVIPDAAVNLMFALVITVDPRRCGHRDAQVPALRDRRDHLEDARLRRAVGDPRRRLRGARARRPVDLLRRSQAALTSRSPRRRSSSPPCSCPLRSRVQRFVDRRFYRRRYDAQRTLESFGARLREQIDLDSLEHDLRGVVTETMQPAHASVWLRTGMSR